MRELLLLLRMARLARQRPSRQRLILFAVVLGLVAAIGLTEYLGLWPEALTLDRPPRTPRLPRP